MAFSLITFNFWLTSSDFSRTPGGTRTPGRITILEEKNTLGTFTMFWKTHLRTKTFCRKKQGERYEQKN